ncbi:MAG: RsmB/NOP family class I SAM-dependent RNA methyltransferase [Sneathiellaceae bacterium]
MTPAARLAAAAEVFAQVMAGAQPADRILHNWGKARRFAGSGDRRKIRDLVYAALRQRGRLAWELYGPAAPAAAPGDRLVLLAASGLPAGEIAALCGSGPYAPPALDPGERRALQDAAEGRHRPGMPFWAAANIPPVLEGRFRQRFGAAVAPALAALNDRAPLDLRVNRARADRDAVLHRLQAEGIAATAAPLAPDGIRLAAAEERGPLAARDHPLLRDGTLVPQDAASQYVAHRLGAAPGMTVLDLCAGAGGKTLALAADMAGEGRLLASDGAADRLARLRPRAAQAGARVECLAWPPPGDLRGRCDRVLVDAPCSGTGTWRRAPEDRWRLDEGRLAALRAVQRDLLDRAAGYLAPGGQLLYATCSLLPEEGEEQVLRFLGRHPDFTCLPEEAAGDIAGPPVGRILAPHRDGTDGFFLARLARPAMAQP